MANLTDEDITKLLEVINNQYALDMTGATLEALLAKISTNEASIEALRTAIAKNSSDLSSLTNVLRTSYGELGNKVALIVENGSVKSAVILSLLKDASGKLTSELELNADNIKIGEIGSNIKFGGQITANAGGEIGGFKFQNYTDANGTPKMTAEKETSETETDEVLKQNVNYAKTSTISIEPTNGIKQEYKKDDSTNSIEKKGTTLFCADGFFSTYSRYTKGQTATKERFSNVTPTEFKLGVTDKTDNTEFISFNVLFDGSGSIANNAITWTKEGKLSLNEDVTFNGVLSANTSGNIGGFKFNKDDSLYSDYQEKESGTSEENGDYDTTTDYTIELTPQKYSQSYYRAVKYKDTSVFPMYEQGKVSITPFGITTSYQKKYGNMPFRYEFISKLDTKGIAVGTRNGEYGTINYSLLVSEEEGVIGNGAIKWKEENNQIKVEFDNTKIPYFQQLENELAERKGDFEKLATYLESMIDLDELTYNDKIVVKIENVKGYNALVEEIKTLKSSLAHLQDQFDIFIPSESNAPSQSINNVYEFEIYEDASCTTKPTKGNEYSKLYLKANVEVSSAREENYGNNLIITNGTDVKNISFNTDFTAEYNSLVIPKGTIIELSYGGGDAMTMDADNTTFGTIVAE